MEDRSTSKNTALSSITRSSAHTELKPALLMLDQALLSRIRNESPAQLGESYARGEWETDNLDQLMYQVFTTQKLSIFRTETLRLAGYLAGLLLRNPQTGRGIFEVADRHYNLGNDLFRAMLDSNMRYTCGYFANSSNLEEAQEAKLDLVCRKLDLRPGLKILDIGCGWGNFAKFAAERYGVLVDGITISKEQAILAKQRTAGLPVNIILEDYRRIRGQYDRIVSIEMIEAVGRRNLRTYFETVHGNLKDNGLFLLESIAGETVSRHASLSIFHFFMWILKYIFPNGYIPRIDELINPGRDLFVVEDLHNFGADYDRTLLCWEENFSRSWATLKSNYDETFRRIWRFYLLSCAALFRAREIHCLHIVYSKGRRLGGYSSVR